MGALHAKDGNFDAYVFIHTAQPEDPTLDVRGVIAGVGDLLRERGDGFVAQVVGPFLAFARLEVSSLDELQGLIAGDLWRAGIRSDWSTSLQPSRLASPKRGSPDHCALVRARASQPFELLDELDRRFETLRSEENQYWYGASVVAGSYDLLVDLGRPTFQELKNALIEDLLSVPGFESTATSFAYLPGNAISFNEGVENAG